MGALNAGAPVVAAKSDSILGRSFVDFARKLDADLARETA
jgi:hypothetical protein